MRTQIQDKASKISSVPTGLVDMWMMSFQGVARREQSRLGLQQDELSFHCPLSEAETSQRSDTEP
jgi:hypothetical protein